MVESASFDLLVIGGGPAGYVGAIRAAQLGMSSVCIEADKLGGICLNWGCIPTKTLLAGAEFYDRLKHEAAAWGIHAENVRHDWQKVLGRSRDVAGRLNKGVHFLFKKNNVAHIQGRATITGPGRVEVRDAGDSGAVIREIACKHILICTGAVPRQLPGTPFDGRTVISYKEAVSLQQQPKKLLILGAGAIGMEFAYIYNAYGTEVTVVEMLDRVLPAEDADASAVVARAFAKQKINCRTGMKSTAVEVSEHQVQLAIAPAGGPGQDPSKTQTLSADKLLVAIGVRGRVEGLFDVAVPIEVDAGHIKVDPVTYATSVDGIYAAGDVIGPPYLAHVGSEEAIICVERIAGHEPPPIDYEAIPACTYCLPQVASLGRTEQKLKEEGLVEGRDYKVGKFPFRASGKAQAIGYTEGFVKLLTGAMHGKILGVHMVGESVTELLAEMSLAKRLEATGDELISTMHAHPTLSEAVREAALDAAGRVIHM